MTCIFHWPSFVVSNIRGEPRFPWVERTNKRSQITRPRITFLTQSALRIAMMLVGLWNIKILLIQKMNFLLGFFRSIFFKQTPMTVLSAWAIKCSKAKQLWTNDNFPTDHKNSFTSTSTTNTTTTTNTNTTTIIRTGNRQLTNHRKKSWNNNRKHQVGNFLLSNKTKSREKFEEKKLWKFKTFAST